jgi:hypothetical protein
VSEEPAPSTDSTKKIELDDIEIRRKTENTNREIFLIKTYSRQEYASKKQALA